MAVVHTGRRRGRGLGAFDQAAWDAYQAGVSTGAPLGPPNGTLEDPNGGVIHFDANGQNDYYTPPAAYAAGKPLDNITEKNLASTFYGWTEYEKAAYQAAAYGGDGSIETDYLRANTQAGQSPSAAVLAENERQLLAFAASSPKIQAALKQLQTGAFRGAQQGTYDAQHAATVLGNAKELLKAWLAQRKYLIDHGANPADLPKFPPVSFTGPLDAETNAALQQLVNALPPDAAPLPPQVIQITNTLPILTPPTTTGSPVIPEYVAPAFPSGGGGNAPPSGGGQFVDSNPGSSMQMPTSGGGGPGFDMGGGAGAPAAASGGLFSSPLVLGAAAIVAVMLFGKRRS